MPADLSQLTAQDLQKLCALAEQDFAVSSCLFNGPKLKTYQRLTMLAVDAPHVVFTFHPRAAVRAAIAAGHLPDRKIILQRHET